MVGKITKYEKARLIGSRALQLSMGAPIAIKLSEKELEAINYSPIEIAKKEFEKDVIPIQILKPLKRERTPEELATPEETVEEENSSKTKDVIEDKKSSKTENVVKEENSSKTKDVIEDKKSSKTENVVKEVMEELEEAIESEKTDSKTDVIEEKSSSKTKDVIEEKKSDSKTVKKD